MWRFIEGLYGYDFSCCKVFKVLSSIGYIVSIVIKVTACANNLLTEDLFVAKENCKIMDVSNGAYYHEQMYLDRKTDYYGIHTINQFWSSNSLSLVSCFLLGVDFAKELVTDNISHVPSFCSLC